MADPDNPTRRAWLAVAVLGGAAFVIGIWEPLADGLDRHFPSRDVVGARGSSAANWQIELASGGDESAAVREALSSVPAGLAARIGAFGGRIVLTHSDRLEHIRYLEETDLLRAAGVYERDTRTAYVSTDGEGSGQTALHEVGHMLDHAMGDLSAQPRFLAIYEQARARGLLSPYARGHPQECFADVFERYYFSDRRREELATEFPAASEYMRALEHDAAP